jgi:hypothetical protein
VGAFFELNSDWIFSCIHSSLRKGYGNVDGVLQSDIVWDAQMKVKVVGRKNLLPILLKKCGHTTKYRQFFCPEKAASFVPPDFFWDIINNLLKREPHKIETNFCWPIQQQTLEQTNRSDTTNLNS